MKSFIKLVSANVLALALVLGIFIFGSVMLLISFSVAVNQDIVSVEDGSVLVVDLGVNLSDTPPEETFSQVADELIYGKGVERIYLLEMIDAIDQAAADHRIEALYLHGSFIAENYGSGYAALKELRQAIEAFKKTGKPVYAYAVAPSLRDYYVMACADHFYLNPFGLLTFNGMASEMVFFGQAFDKYGIGIQTTRVGKYKSAVEMFIQDEMSEENRYQIKTLLDSIWSDIVNDVAVSRRIDASVLNEISNTKGFFKAEDAEKYSLVDKVAYLDEVIDALKKKHEADKDGKTFKQVALANYIQDSGMSVRNRVFESDNQIAVVYAEGDIVDGEGEFGQVGGDSLARRIRALRNDDKVKAMVLRVNSPGGSAVASELIQREIREFMKEKPVVVSMGTLAASGGYWISAYSNKIFAEPSTITGSIGVFGVLFNIGEIAKNWGVTFDGVKTSEYSDIFTVSRPKNESEMELIQSFTDIIYDEFLRKVSEGRNLTVEQVHEIAQGRVWTGADAKEVGLVDETGGLQDAIEHAVELADVGADWELKQVPEKKDLASYIEEYLEESAGGASLGVSAAKNDVVHQTLSMLKRELNKLKTFNDPKGIYARLPYELILK